MSSQLEQLLGYLDREGVTQVIIGTGRPITMRTPTGFTNITARPLSAEQLANFLRHPEIAPLVPDTDGEGDIVDIQIGRRRAVAQVRKRGHELLLSLSRSETAASPVATQPPARVATPRTTVPAVTPTPTAAPSTRFTAPAAVAPTPTGSTTSRFTTPAAVAPTPTPPATGGNAFDSLSLDAGIELGALGNAGALELDDLAPTRAPDPAARPASPARGAMMSLDLGDDLAAEDPGSDASVGFSLELDPADVAAASARSPSAISRGAPVVPAVSFAPPRSAPSAEPAAPAATASPAGAGDFGSLLRAARERGASDLHVSAARVTSIRVITDLVPLDPGAPPLSAAAVDDLLLPLLDDALRAQLGEVGYVDLALEAPGGGRLRANISRQQQGLKGTFRLALAAPATLEQLGLPVDLGKVVQHHQGLVIIAGPSGQGKTTTLAALVDMLNSTRPYHILTIEDPVEIVHSRKQAVISQRETGRHTTSFARGLKASLREDPDVIVIGELRDRESVEIALTAAETGHLVIATMSTPSASKTIDRLIDMFPPEEHNQVRASIAGALRAIVAQRLLPKRGGGVIPAIELVTGVLPLAVMIREDKLYQLPNLLQRGRAFGMIRFDESLAEHVRAGRVDEEAALAVAESRKDLAIALHPAAPAAAAKTTPLWGFGKKDQR